MFKGLRTKIESEQKGEATIRSVSPLQPNKDSISNCCGNESIDKSLVTRDGNNLKQENLININRQTINEISGEAVNIVAFPQVNSLDRAEQISVLENEDLSKELYKLSSTVTSLRDEISSITKARDECNDQNLQLHQLIEKLHKNLEKEKEINSSLESRLNEIETTLKERDDLIDKLRSSPKSISFKSFSSKESTLEQPQTLENLHVKIGDLQDQLSEKTRQIRIQNQNINDLKKALQKEISDHSKTQDELNKVQSQLKQQIQNKSDQNSGNGSNLQNGSTSCDIEANLKSSTNIQNGSCEGGQSIVSHDKNENMLPAQMDRMSMLSRSSASVDDFDSNDLQTSCDREVNHEYLRNVLFRYMTSTDTITAKHLVKAISVMMNFTPEQSAAVKSAINARTSWLRLK